MTIDLTIIGLPNCGAADRALLLQDLAAGIRQQYRQWNGKGYRMGNVIWHNETYTMLVDFGEKFAVLWHGDHLAELRHSPQDKAAPWSIDARPRQRVALVIE